MDEAIASLGELSAATSTAGRARTPSSMKIACVDVEITGTEFLSLSKPRPMPSSAWSRVRKAAKYSVKSAQACQSGEFDLAVTYANRATYEFEQADQLIQKYIG
jgi:hypothetical protein